MTWHDATESGQPVSMIRWCRSRPSVFFVVDADSCLYIWDLNMDESSALKRERITQQSRSGHLVDYGLFVPSTVHTIRAMYF